MKVALYGIVGVVASAIFFLIISLTSGGGETETAPAMISTTGESDMGGWFLTIFIIAVVSILTYRWRRGKVPPIWITVTTVCTPLFLWGFWLIRPEWYLEWRHSGYFLWTILTVGALGWLADNKTEAIARTARRGLLLLVIVAVGMGAYGKWPKSDINLPATASVTPSVSLSPLPADVVLPIIAECESGGRQFDDDGNLITNATTTAVGKYQIMASLHEEKAKGLGHDIRTLEGNEAYARILYGESGTEHWEADSESRACWEPKLLALAGLPPSTIRLVVEVGREWTEPIRLPTGRRVDWMPRSVVSYEIMTADGKVVSFPAVKQAPIDVPSILAPWFKFRAVDADSVTIDIVHYALR